jgi:hypothetical protein
MYKEKSSFEGYLQWHRLPYVGVDEGRRSFLDDDRVKSLDFIVHGETGGWLIDVKGRRFPAGTPEQPRRTWECWSTLEDIDSLQRWAERFGATYRPLLTFMYHLTAPGVSVAEDDDLWTWQGRRYLLRGIPVEDYQVAMRVRSPKWGTVSLGMADFRRLARPFYALMRPSTVPCPLFDCLAPAYSQPFSNDSSLNS